VDFDTDACLEALNERQLLQHRNRNLILDCVTETSRELRVLILRQIRYMATRPCSHKTWVILALASRATQLSEALFILDHSGLRDEAAALLRILIEVVINGAYLMVTGEKEFNAFVAHPVVLMGKHHLAYVESSNHQNSFTEGFNQLVATSAADAALRSGRTPKDSSWTSESVLKRAAIADAVFKHVLFCDLATTSYVDGHDFIHGNFPALVGIIADLQGETLSTKEVQTDRNAMLHGATSSLLGYALSLDQHFQMDFHTELQRIILNFAKGEAL
jgi:hypothetical protein